MLLPRRRTASIRTGNFDWTSETGIDTATDFQKSVQNVDWSTSPLGAIEKWPATVRSMVLMCIADSTASAVLYTTAIGASIVYNEEFAGLLGKRHPGLQGQLVQEKLVDMCPEFDQAWERQVGSGRVEILPNQRIRQDRLGFVEERTYTWKLLPYLGDDGSVVGSIVTVDEDNKSQARRDRSKSAVRELGNVMKGAIDHTTKQTAASILRLDQHFSGRSCNCVKLWEVEKQIEIYEARYEKFADSAPIGIAAIGSDYSIDWANRAYFDVMDQPSDSKTFLDSIHPDDVAKVQGQFELGSFREQSYSFQCRLRRLAAPSAVSPGENIPESSPAWIMVRAFKDVDSASNNTMCWIIDITKHKAAEEFLRKRMDDAIEHKRAKERFIDQISHEVRNPLSAMIHCTDEIIQDIQRKEDDSLSEVLEAAQTIAHCTQHIKNIVDDVLTLSKLDSHLVQIRPQPAMPRKAIDTAVRIFHGELRASGVELVIENDSSLGEEEWLVIDTGRTLQVLFNLVTNAIKVVKGREQRKIVVRLRVSHRPDPPTGSIRYVLPRQEPKPVDFGPEFSASKSLFLILSVQDTGPGLSPEELSSLIERFAQVSPKTESKYGGSGLGLFISRDLTELHGGRLGLATETGVGSTFSFSVECKRTTAPQETVPQIEIPEIPQRSGTSHSFVRSLDTRALSGQGVTRAQQEKEIVVTRRVLIVEDNLINQKVLANQLRKRSFEVKVAQHGKEALDLLQMTIERPVPPVISRKPVARTLFDVVLMDIEMPVMDGISCVKRIRAYETSRGTQTRLPIIAVTANARSEHGTTAIEAGMDSITTKPYKIEELVDQIEKVCTPPEVYTPLG